MPVGARLALLAWARANGTYIVEDDYDSEYRYDGPPLEAVHALDREGRTIYVGTLSKVLFPALRLGYLVVPDALVSVFARAKWLADRHTPALLQLALADFIREGHFERHLRRARKQNAARRALLLEELRRHLGDRVELQGENAGVHIVVWLRHLSADRLDRLLAGARTRGVGVYSVASYYAKPPNRQGLMLGFSALGRQAIREGVRRFAEAYREVVETRVRGRMTGEVVPGTARKVAL
jgi:GntR family transcriptional regulator/MocR family aminotransferase